MFSLEIAMEHHHVPISPDGRLVLPASLRHLLHVEEGGQIVIRKEGGHLVLESLDDAVRRAQALVRHYAPSAQDVTDEFLNERRAAAAHE